VATTGEAERRALTGRAGIVALGTLASRVLGLGREMALAAIFPRAATDAFMIAFLFPNLLRQLLAEGAVQSAVLPVLTDTLEKRGSQAARRFHRAIRGISLVILLAVALLGIAGAPLLVDAFAGGFRDHPGQFELTVELTRWMFPYILFMGSAALGVAALNTYRRFVVTAFAPALLNVAFIACALLLPAWFAARGRDPIMAMAAGALLGGLLQLVAQWPSLSRIGYLEPPRLELKNPEVRETLRRMLPVLIGTGIYLLDTLVSRRLLSEFDIGSQTYFGFALRLCDFPQGVLIMALQSATLPSLSSLFARGEHAEVEKTFAYGVRLALFVGIPASALCITLAEPLVVMIFQRGEFDAPAARETAKALAAQSAGIWTVACVRQIITVYYALGDTRTPVVVAALDFLAFLGLALALRGPFGHVGISMAVAGSSLVQMLLLWFGLKRRLGNLRTLEIARSGARTLAASIAAAVSAFWAAHEVARIAGTGALTAWLPGLLGVVVFGLVFVLGAGLLRSEELDALLAAAQRRRRKAS